MNKRPPLKLSFDYTDTPERRVLSLEPDGILCMPVIGFDCFRKKWGQAPMHVHDECLEVSLCLRGDLEFETANGSRLFRPGSIFVSGPRDLHRLKAYPKGMSKYWFLFRLPKRGFPLLNLPQKEAGALVSSLSGLRNRMFGATDDVRRNFKQIFRLYDVLPSGTPARSLRLRSAVLSLLLAVVDAAEVPTQSRAEIRLKQLVDDMREHPEREYLIDRIAERLGLSPSNLLLRFKRLTGLPPHAFLLERRIDKAKELLPAANSVAAVAHRLGFSTSQHFSNQFKAMSGMSPRAWRQSNVSL